MLYIDEWVVFYPETHRGEASWARRNDLKLDEINGTYLFFSGRNLYGIVEDLRSEGA